MKIETIEQIEQLVKVFEKSSLMELHFESGDANIFMSRKGEAAHPGAAVPHTAAPAKAIVRDDEDESAPYISSPIVGTFYATPSPEEKPFVAVGDTVKAGQTVCILEAMKLMTEIKSDFDCTIEAVLVSNAQKVEYGQPLFRVKKIQN